MSYKSLMRTCCLIISFTILFCCTSSISAEPKTNPDTKKVGRYQIYMPNGDNASALGAILLDTATGDTWRLFEYTDMRNDPMIWTPLDKAKSKDAIFQLGEKVYGWKPEEPSKK